MVSLMSKPSSKKYGNRYPWKLWFKEKRFVLTKGKEFHGKTYTMAQQVRNKANSLGIRVSIHMSKDDSTITVEIIK